MDEIKTPSKPASLAYFWIGLIATFGYRVIIVLNFYDPLWVKVAWYVGTIGFIVYFWSRYRVVRQYNALIRERKLVSAVKKASGISEEQKEGLAHIVTTLEATKAQLNYVIIFILSAIALAAGVYLDFVA